MKCITSLLLFILLSLIFSCSSDSNNQPEPDIDSPIIVISIAGFSSTSTTPIVVSKKIEINIDAKDAGGISKIEAFLDNEKVGEDLSAPYFISVDVSSYTSKIASSNKYKNYTLKVTATDKTGNISSTEQIINIDNELPSISGVSLLENQIIAGDSNEVTFFVTDNQEISSVTVFLNDTALSLIEGDTLKVNIPTLNLPEGANTLKIEATDNAKNIANYSVNFISDNTGPEISLESLMEGQILDESIILNPIVKDDYSEVTLLEILLGDSSIALFEESASNYEVDFDPSQFPTGTGIIIVRAKDDLNNETRIEIPIEIYRRLIIMNFPINYYDPQLARIFVFASSLDGKVLDVERVFHDTQQVILRTQNDIELDMEFALTIAEYQSGDYGNNSNLTTLQNLKSSTLEVINMKTAPRFDTMPRDPYSFPTSGFDSADSFNSTAYGFGYSGGLNGDNKINIDRRKNTSSDTNTELIYLWLKNETLNEYSYTILDWDLSSDFVLDQNLFTQDGIERRFYQTSLGSGDYISSMNIIGYFSESDFENNVFHNINNSAYAFIPTQGAPYYFNQNIYKTRYEFTMPNYYTSRIGEPLTLFQDIDWTLDYLLNGKEIYLSKTGTGHSTGKVYLLSTSNTPINGLSVSFGWNITFNSETTDTIILPELPDELQTWGLNELYKNNNFDIRQVEIKSYEGISSYDEYLLKVIKNNNFIHTITPKIEAKFNRHDGYNSYYYKETNSIFD